MIYKILLFKLQLKKVYQDIAELPFGVIINSVNKILFFCQYFRNKLENYIFYIWISVCFVYLINHGLYVGTGTAVEVRGISRPGLPTFVVAARKHFADAG